jgi:hypothetical protein
MRYLRSFQGRKLTPVVVAVAIAVAVAVVADPELRALLLVVDALGMDIILILLATQLRVLTHAFPPLMYIGWRSCCALAFRLGSDALKAYPGAVAWQPFDRLVCPALVLMSYGILCRQFSH